MNKNIFILFSLGLLRSFFFFSTSDGSFMSCVESRFTGLSPSLRHICTAPAVVPMSERDGGKREPCAFTLWKLSLFLFILLGVGALGSAIRGGLTPAHTKATKNKEVFTNLFTESKEVWVL